MGIIHWKRCGYQLHSLISTFLSGWHSRLYILPPRQSCCLILDTAQGDHRFRETHFLDLNGHNWVTVQSQQAFGNLGTLTPQTLFFSCFECLCAHHFSSTWWNHFFPSRLTRWRVSPLYLSLFFPLNSREISYASIIYHVDFVTLHSL